MFLKFVSLSVVVLVCAAAIYVFANNQLAAKRGEVVITDADLKASAKVTEKEIEEAKAAAKETESSQVKPGNAGEGSSQLLGDLSVISTTVDGLGNKSETRVFKNDPRIKQVLVKTGRDGSVIAYVYAHIGGVKVLTGALASRMLTSPASEIASAADIFETRLDKERRLISAPTSAPTLLRPLSSDEIELNENPATGRKAETVQPDAPQKSSGD